MPLFYETYRALGDEPGIVITLAIVNVLLVVLLIWAVTRR